ncbi:MAG: hypothetical protein ACLT9P_00525 [Evtepia gabavorous]
MPNRRLPAAAAFFAAALTAFAVLLWGLQVTSGSGALLCQIPAKHCPSGNRPRRPGRLLDRNGTILAQDQVSLGRRFGETWRTRWSAV